MRVRLGVLGGLLAVTCVGCGGSSRSAPSTSPATSSTASSPAPSESSPGPAHLDPDSGALLIDTGGTQLTGLAVAAGSVWAISYDTATVTRIDPRSYSVTGAIPVSGAATVAALHTGLWVAAYGDPGQLVRIDPRTESVTDTVDVGDLCCDLTEGGGLVWALDRHGNVLGVDPSSATVVKRFPVRVDRNAHNNVVFAGGYVWVSSDTTALFRFDPVTGERRSFDVGGGVPFLAQDGVLWGATPTELWSVRPATGDVLRRIPLPDSTEVMALAIDGRTGWVGMRRPGSIGAVLQLDLTTGRVRAEVPVDIPAHIEVAFGSAWVSDSGSSLVWRI